MIQKTLESLLVLVIGILIVSSVLQQTESFLTASLLFIVLIGFIFAVFRKML